MPLPMPAPARRHLHTRRIEMNGYARSDGLFDIEGHLVDTKPMAFQVKVGPLRDPGEPMHGMWIRLTIDAGLVVHDAVASSDVVPYADCLLAPATLSRLVGLKIGSGWRREIKERLGGNQSCTHLVEMLAPLGTVAIQALVTEVGEVQLPVKASGQPRQIDTCLATSSDRRVAALRWPEHYTGARDADGHPVAPDGIRHDASKPASPKR